MFNQEESIAQYFKDLANKAKPLSKEEELILAGKIQEGCSASVEKLVTANLKFAITQARKHLHMGLSEADLIQEANIAMIKAAHRFTPDSDNKFITYAYHWIRKACNEAVVEKGKIVKLPMHQEIELYKKRVGGESISHSRTIEVDAPVGDDGKNTIGDLMLKTLSSVEDQHREEDIVHTVNNMLSQLKERDRQVIEAFYGVNHEYPVSVDDIAEKHDLTSTRINQIVRTTKKQLKEILLNSI